MINNCFQFVDNKFFANDYQLMNYTLFLRNEGEICIDTYRTPDPWSGI